MSVVTVCKLWNTITAVHPWIKCQVQVWDIKTASCKTPSCRNGWGVNKKTDSASSQCCHYASSLFSISLLLSKYTFTTENTPAIIGYSYKKEPEPNQDGVCWIWRTTLFCHTENTFQSRNVSESALKRTRHVSL